MAGDFFEVGGQLARGLRDYEERPEQARMAQAVSEALEDGTHLLVEAGTGTGKSLAYLMPALESGLRVVVSTGTRSLQDQLLRRELPVLREILERPFQAVPLKGTRNYLCRRKFAAAMSNPQNHSESSPELAAIEAWALRTETGDRAELAGLAEDAEIWSEVTTAPESRLGARCPYYETCFVTRARREAEKAELVVVNHHLFFSDLALRKDTPGARVLPDYQAVVFDEAHGLEEVITEHFGVDISTSRIEQLVRDLRRQAERDTGGGRDLWNPKPSQRAIDGVTNAAQVFFAALRRRLSPLAQASEGERFTLPDDLLDEHLQVDWLALDSALEEAYASARRRADALRDNEGGRNDETSEELFSLAERCQRIRDDLAAIADRDPKLRDFVFWGRLRGLSVSLHASPVSVSQVLRDELLPRVHSAIFTSATLSAGQSFSHIRQRLGLERESASELQVASPFDYRRQCLLYLPRDIPEPADIAQRHKRHQRMAELLTLTDGHAFVLFTSYRAMEDAFVALQKLIALPLRMQGQAPREHLVEAFRNQPRSVLLATSSFWEGVDVPGRALSHVIIDKLPFDVPGDPLGEARMRVLESQGLAPFDHYQLPRAAIGFRQGFGRLIRRKGDRGIVSILDPRIVSRRYGRVFLQSLPEVARTSSWEQLRRFWSEIEAERESQGAAGH